MRSRFQVLFAFVAAATFAGGAIASAADATIFRLADPRGDDHGSGSLVYPVRNDLHTGDLDIVSLVAKEDPAGTLFEATFARPIAAPDRRPIDEVGQTLDRVARRGFYTVNLDIYSDTDRVPGSGQLALLPGRKAEVDPSTAWEKAICLTPRPADARDLMLHILQGYARRDMKAKLGRIDAAEMDRRKGEIERDVDSRIFFPTRVVVNGTKVSFVVPVTFLHGRARADWSYVVAVSGADIDLRVNPTAALGLTTPPPDSLMIVPVGATPRDDRFGGAPEEDEFAPPLVDILVPPGKSQEAVLKDYDPAEKRLVRLPGLVPADVK